MYQLNMCGCKPSYYSNLADVLKTCNYLYFNVTRRLSIRRVNMNTINKNIYLGRA